MKHIVAADGVSAIDMTTVYNYKKLKENFPREVLEKLLLEEGYTYRQLQELYVYNERLWSKLAREYNIPKQFHIISQNANKYHKVEIDDNILIDLYVNRKLSLRIISQEIGCNRTTIRNRLIQLNIDIRPSSDENYYLNRKYRECQDFHRDGEGYIRKSTQRQHRLVMEEYLGRKLTPQEHVHHIDFNKSNNDISNLFLFENSKIHSSYHGYIKKYEYISPHDFMLNVYSKILYYKSFEFLYEQYIVSNKSIAQIEREINGYVNRTTITKLLKQYGLFVSDKHVNQYQ